MLANTFCHIPGVGTTVEQQLWNAGFHQHQQVLDADNLNLPIDHGTLKEHCHSSHQALKQGNSIFYENLPPKKMDV